MNLYQTFKADESMEKTGIDLQYGPDCKIRIARAGGSNRRYGKLLGERLKPFRRQMDNGTLDDAVAAELMAEVYAESVILGWTGVDGPDGQPLDFNRENCVKLLTDLPELFRDIQEQAAKIANFRAAEREADAKN
jgi:hypothetical protein